MVTGKKVIVIGGDSAVYQPQYLLDKKDLMLLYMKRIIILEEN
jgi:hypothetical protein